KIAVPRDQPYTDIKQLDGKSIATSYPVILRKFLEKNGIEATIQTLSGSVEIATGLGLSDAICDLVSTGGTLKNNGLVPFVDVLSSEAVLIGRPELNGNPVLEELLQRLRSVLTAKETKYVVLNVER